MRPYEEEIRKELILACSEKLEGDLGFEIAHGREDGVIFAGGVKQIGAAEKR